MFVVEKAILLACPLATVFDFCTNPHNRVLWDSHVISGRYLTPPPLKVGARFALTVRQQNVIREIEREVISYKPNRKFSYSFETETAYIINHQLFDEQANQTRFHIWIEYEPKGLVQWFAKPFAYQQEHDLEKDLTRLKQILEERCRE